MKVFCCVCERELFQPGALLFGVPDEHEMTRKQHICLTCWSLARVWLDNMRSALKIPPIMPVSALPPHEEWRIKAEELQALVTRQATLIDLLKQNLREADDRVLHKSKLLDEAHRKIGTLNVAARRRR